MENIKINFDSFDSVGYALLEKRRDALIERAQAESDEHIQADLIEQCGIILMLQSFMAREHFRQVLDAKLAAKIPPHIMRDDGCMSICPN